MKIMGGNMQIRYLSTVAFIVMLNESAWAVPVVKSAPVPASPVIERRTHTYLTFAFADVNFYDGSKFGNGMAKITLSLENEGSDLKSVLYNDTRSGGWHTQNHMEQFQITFILLNAVGAELGRVQENGYIGCREYLGSVKRKTTPEIGSVIAQVASVRMDVGPQAVDAC
ncbi:hypothetical protein F2P45_31685 [Massilia sp. CCM 8733]|uniref:Uncharacterized protein n=1 Tax=Massilia mucilaginosa TaxID=2609282 RepID=A0ABX0P3L8_9BURK|nr:hypothetical protein [Massilia mucilaginosa]NHZ93529.1 hypothetical protein [Massilia mucilaginosa]